MHFKRKQAVGSIDVNREQLQVPAGSPGAKRSPLSFAQQRLWFLEQLEPGGSAYNINQLLRLSGPLNEEAFQKALNAIVARHEAMRTIFAWQDGEPVQVIVPTLKIFLKGREKLKHGAERR